MRKLFKWKGLLVSVLLSLCGTMAWSQKILVSHTDFSCDNEDAYYESVDDITGFSGVIKPWISVSSGYTTPPSTASRYGISEGKYIEPYAYSVFLQGLADVEDPSDPDMTRVGNYYAVTPNPTRLDSFRLYDNEDSGDWGIVFSMEDKQFQGEPGKELMSYRIPGLKNSGGYKIEITYCNPLSSDYLKSDSDVNKNSKKKGGPYQESGYNCALKVSVNSDGKGGDYVGQPKGTAGGCSTWEFELKNASSNMCSIVDGEFDMHIYCNQAGAWQAIMITDIKVYAEVEAKISGVNSVCTGENTVLSVSAEFLNCKYQWYRDGSPIAGATGTTYKHESGNEEKTYKYTVKITSADGKTSLTTEPFEVKDEVCCVDDKGNPMSRKMIWQDDFGTFTAKGKYWTWDYSKDINEPVKKTGTTTGWTYCPSYDIPVGGGDGCVTKITDEGQYLIAGNVTCVWDDLSGGDGTQWEWQAQCFNGQNPGKNGWKFVPDHTYEGSAWGGMLFLNCGNEAGETIYRQEVNGLCDKDVEVRAYINNFSSSDNDVSIFIRVTDKESGEYAECKPITRNAKGADGIGWKEVKVKLKLTGNNPSMIFEIISNVGGRDYNHDGNDLVLDDIQVWTCTPPSVALYFDDNAVETESCKGDDVNLRVDVTEGIKHTYGADARYVFQYNKDPEDKKGWITIGTPITPESFMEDMSEVFALFESDDKIYFRVVLGSENTLKSTTYYNKDQACADYTVSDPIVATVVCPTCTEPADDIKIKVSSAKPNKATSVDGKTPTYQLCFGESITLSQEADITPAESEWASAEFKGFAINWFKGEKPTKVTGGDVVLNGVTTNKVITYDDEALAGTEQLYTLHAIDANYLEGSCETQDQIYIKFNPIPDVDLTDPDPFCYGLGTGKVDLTSKYSLKWFSDADTASSSLPSAGVNAAFFEGLDGQEDPYEFYYYPFDSKTGCKGDLKKFTVTVNEVPVAPAPIDTEVVVSVGSEAFVYDADVPSGATQLWFENATGGSGSTMYLQIDRTKETTYTIYRAFQSAERCMSERNEVKITVKSAPKPSVNDWDLCLASAAGFDVSTLAETTDDIYELHWYSADDKTSAELSATDLQLSATTTPGEYTYYVTQKSTEVPYPESDIAKIVVTVYDVMEPEVEDVEYCADATALPLTATKKENHAAYMGATNVVWKLGVTENDDANPPVPNTAVTADGVTDIVYDVYQTYTTPISKEKCTGNSVTQKVSVSKVKSPTGTLSVSYVKADGAPSGFSKNIMQQSNNTVVDDASADGLSMIWSKSATGIFGTTVPTPNYDPTVPEGTLETYTYYVKYVDAAGCESDPVEVTVTISSTPMPEVKSYSYCETYACMGNEVKNLGESESLSDLEGPGAKVNTNGGQLVDGDKYELYWFKNQDDAKASMTDPSLLTTKGTTAPPSICGFITVASNHFDATTTSETFSLYVVQAYGATVSAPSTVNITIYAAPKLELGDVKAVCNENVDLTSPTLWHVSNNVTLTTTAEYMDGATSVTTSANNISKSGTYSVVSQFTVPNSKEVCKSDPLNIEIDIQRLELTPHIPEQTCPNTPIDVTVDVNYDYNSNATGTNYPHNVSWTGTEGIQPEENVTELPTVTEIQYTTQPLAGVYGDKYTVTLEVTAGVCKETVSGIVKLQDGPVTGKFTYTEVGNLLSGSGYTSNIGAKNDVYTCGTDVEIDLSNVKMTEATVEWFTSDNYSSTPVKTGKIVSLNPAVTTTYYVRYTNECYAYTQFTIHPEPVTITSTPDPATALCENDAYSYEVTYTCTGTPEFRQWYKDDAEYSNTTTKLDFKKLVKSTHQGKYSYTVRNKGCEDKLDIVDLTVKQYPKFEPVGYELLGTDTVYIVIAGDDQDISLNYTVPTGGTGVDVTWNDNGSASNGTNTLYQLTGVDEDHKIQIVASGADFCETTKNVKVLRDAKLKLDVSLAEKMCLRDENPLVIDTTGTGRFVRGGHSLTIVAMPEGGSTTQEKGFTSMADGTLTKKVSPSVTTEYKVTFEYGSQKEEETVKITVYNFVVTTEPQKVCEGDPVLLSAKVNPADSKLEWFESDKTTSLGMTTVTATPVFEGASMQTSSSHRYYVKAYTDEVQCNSFFSLDVTVYKPLKGSISDTIVCEGSAVRLDAGSYGASKYTWTSSSDANPTLGRYKNDKPTQTTQYFVEMSRGECTAKDDATVEVKKNPQLMSIDSVGYRDVNVIMDNAYGTAPYYFRVDGGEWTSDSYIKDLSYSRHVLEVTDFYMCTSIDTFEVLPPAVNIPNYFSPNDDGENDVWVPVGIGETYPEADIKIFDRFGKLIATLKGSDIGWDGSYNGVAMPSTDYWYEIVIHEIDKIYTGHFTLIRR